MERRSRLILPRRKSKWFLTVRRLDSNRINPEKDPGQDFVPGKNHQEELPQAERVLRKFNEQIY